MSNINAVPDPQTGILRKYADGTANLAFQTNGANAVVINESQIANFVSTGAVTIPRGTTAQRPSPAVNGMFRANSNFGSFEVYLNGSWDNVTAVTTPINSVAPVVSGTPAINQTLTVSNGTWNNSPTSYAYQWLANSVAITSNATSNTFVLTSSQVGANVSCNVTAINAAGFNIPTTSNSVGPVANTYTIDYLVVAGGAGGGNIRGGGGGAGGMLSNTTSVIPGTAYVITVGAGGSSAANGATSSLSNIVSTTGGGFGGSGNGTAGPYFGGNGGSGGGAPSAEGGGLPASMAGGTGVSGQGNNGGANNTNSDANGGGGGGAGAAGSASPSGVGGAGAANSLRTGSTITYAGGGGAGGANNPAKPGSAGGAGGGGPGGQGGIDGATNGVAGTANTGGGGGGGGGTAGTPRSGGAGGSGIVVLRYQNATQRATGGNVTSYTLSGQVYWVHTFTTSGTFTA